MELQNISAQRHMTSVKWTAIELHESSENMELKNISAKRPVSSDKWTTFELHELSQNIKSQQHLHKDI